jgi:hypothetical protein
MNEIVVIPGVIIFFISFWYNLLILFGRINRRL